MMAVAKKPKHCGQAIGENTTNDLDLKQRICPVPLKNPQVNGSTAGQEKQQHQNDKDAT